MQVCGRASVPKVHYTEGVEVHRLYFINLAHMGGEVLVLIVSVCLSVCLSVAILAGAPGT